MYCVMTSKTGLGPTVCLSLKGLASFVFLQAKNISIASRCEPLVVPRKIFII